MKTTCYNKMKTKNKKIVLTIILVSLIQNVLATATYGSINTIIVGNITTNQSIQQLNSTNYVLTTGNNQETLYGNTAPGVSIETQGMTTGYPHLIFNGYGDTKTPIIFAYSTGGTKTAPTITTKNEVLAIGGMIYNGTTYSLGPEIAFYLDGSPNTLGATGRIDFDTKSPTETYSKQAWVMTGTGNFLPGNNAVYDIGNVSNTVRNVITKNIKTMTNNTNYVLINSTIPGIEIHQDSGNDYASYKTYSYGTKTNALFAYRGLGTETTPTVLTANQNILSLVGMPYNGSIYAAGPQIDFRTDSTPGTGGVTGAIDFSSKNTGESYNNIRYVLTEYGHLIPYADNTYSIGNSSNTIKVVHANQIYTPNDLVINESVDQKVLKIYYPALGSVNPAFTAGHGNAGSYMFFGSKYWLNNQDPAAYAMVQYYDQSAAVNGTILIRNEETAGNSSTYPMMGSLILSGGTNSYLELRGDKGIFARNRGNDNWVNIYSAGFIDMVPKEAEEYLTKNNLKPLDTWIDLNPDGTLNGTNSNKGVYSINETGHITSTHPDEGVIDDALKIRQLQIKVNELESRIEKLEKR